MDLRKLAQSAIVFACFAACLPALAAVPPAPLGLEINGRSYALISNSGWKVRTGGSSAFGPVKVVSLIRGPVPGAVNAEDRQQVALIWAQTCTASQQVLTFRRTYFLPGVPKTFGIDLHDTYSFGPPGNKAIAGVKIYINDALAFNLAGAYLSLPVAARPALAKLFKFGANEVEIVVTKRVQSGDFGKCVEGSRKLSLYFLIKGAYQSELWLSADGGKPIERYQRPPQPDKVALKLEVRPRNFGPSGIYRGTLTTEISGDQIYPLGVFPLTVTGEGLRACALTQTSAQLYRLDCEIYNFPDDAEPVVKFAVGVKFIPGYAISTVRIVRSATAWTDDPNFNTNRREDVFYFCGNTTNPKCPPP